MPNETGVGSEGGVWKILVEAPYWPENFGPLWQGPHIPETFPFPWWLIVLIGIVSYDFIRVSK